MSFQLLNLLFSAGLLLLLKGESMFKNE